VLTDLVEKLLYSVKGHLRCSTDEQITHYVRTKRTLNNAWQAAKDKKDLPSEVLER
jgi:hypothetical protein